MQQTSLLAHLYPYFKGSQEDVATSSLNYIISTNESICKAFTNHISKTFGIAITDTFQYKCQAVGENKERPDMAGFDANGDERILCESKFYAPLTANQPNTYISRLIDKNGIGLLFICPGIRKTGLWSEVLEIAGTAFDLTVINENCVLINNSVRLGITTWNNLLTELEQSASINAVNSVADIRQLQGYCEQLDNEAFIPFNDEDLGIDIAKRSERPYRLLDELVTSIKNDANHKVSLEGLNRTPIWSGYRRYIKIDGFGVNLEYDTQKWKNVECKNTPFWISIKRIVNDNWEFDEHCKKTMLKIPAEMKCESYIALVPKKFVALSEVVEDMKKQVYEFIQAFSVNEL